MCKKSQYLITMLLVTLLLAGLALISGCSNEDEGPEPEPDPCEGKSPVSAAFIIEESYRDLDFEVQFYETDTIVPNTVRFTALEEDAEYFWEIGAGTYTEKTFTLQFPAGTLGEVIPIKLTVTKPPDSLCFPMDTGVDSLTKNLTVLSNCENGMSGTFLGERSDKPGEPILLELELQKFQETSVGCGILYMENLDGMGCQKTYNENFMAYNRFHFGSGSTDCDAIAGLIKVINNSDSIYCEILTTSGVGVFQVYTFKGKRQ